MGIDHRVLILGATGRTGGCALTQLLERGVPVRAIVRSAARLPEGSVGNPLLEVVEADVLALPTEVLAEHLAGCDTVISCLGHTISVRGVLGPPHDLVGQAVRLVRDAVDTSQRKQSAAGQPAAPVRLILMSSVSVNQPERADARRGRGERAYMWGMRALVPPARDNQRAADFLVHEVGPADANLQWVIVRPDTLTEGAVAEYRVHEALVSSLFKPDSTRMSEVAHFMCELATDDATWKRWRSRMPVIVDAQPPA
ncbi:MAG: SDR family oxidoreductase [Actinobacteria bacterium]|jgi:nucleoside-diphosphate-sugar epimerase|nr:SDR family oxidoreductase [Actinomycetota bacterium]